MPIYVYSCCGTLFNMVNDRNDCPECGKKDAYDFRRTIDGSIDSQHGLKFSVEGERNYFDEGAGRYFGSSTERKAWLREKGYRPAKSASMAETW